jgi:hypothetical protein
MVGNRPVLGRRGSSDVAAFKVSDLNKATNLRRE